KKVVVPAVIGLLFMAIAGVIVFRTIAAKESNAGVKEVSPKAAKALEEKINRIESAQHSPAHKHGSSRVEVSEAELESGLLYSLKDDIPAQVDSADVQIGTDTISLDTQITFSPNATGNPMVDTVVGGTHNLYVKGNLVGEHARGKFDLLEVRV